MITFNITGIHVIAFDMEYFPLACGIIRHGYVLVMHVVHIL